MKAPGANSTPTSAPPTPSTSSIYRDRITAAYKKAGHADAIYAGTGRIEGAPYNLGVMNFAFMGGSMGSVVGEKIARLARRSADKDLPLVLVCTSGGARMQEGVLSLMQMAKTSAMLAVLREQAIPYITILTNPTTGGVSASFAMQGDVILAEPGAVIGFAGQRVIKQTIGQDLPPGFQTAEFLLDHGQIDDVVPRGALKETTARLLRHMSGQAGAGGGGGGDVEQGEGSREQGAGGSALASPSSFQPAATVTLLPAPSRWVGSGGGGSGSGGRRTPARRGRPRRRP